MKPRAYNPVSIKMAMETDVIPNMIDTRVIDCPNCDFRIPIHEEVVNYKVMYEKQREYACTLYNNFCDYLDDMALEIPDAKIWMENYKQNLIDKIDNALKGIREDL